MEFHLNSHCHQIQIELIQVQYASINTTLNALSVDFSGDKIYESQQDLCMCACAIGVLQSEN